MSNRVAAFALAIFATFWGLLAAGPFLWGLRVETMVILAPAYLMTLGYWARATLNLPRDARMAVWWVSLIVQGCWSLVGVWGLLGGEFSGGFFLILLWWWSSTVLSVWCLRNEPPESDEWLSAWEAYERPRTDR